MTRIGGLQNSIIRLIGRLRVGYKVASTDRARPAALAVVDLVVDPVPQKQKDQPA